MRVVRSVYPGWTVGVVFPYRRHSRDLQALADRSFLVGRDHYAKFQLPDPVWSAAGRPVCKPTAW